MTHPGLSQPRREGSVDGSWKAQVSLLENDPAEAPQESQSMMEILQGERSTSQDANMQHWTSD